uniref:tRNA (cytosine(34)-C(5))-methyltransferase n=1 Tax=Ciona intestinalis TaxID=7719 RepID=UPI00005211DB|nr:tRNA (cytosine(34)-C(5))-methyltransferase [Ciona intestinalis]|eukprot:XP_018673469.1 tRNA (cytosine(34)-C(5))-methyltransferase [Ciona intestinalis]
MGRRRKKFQLKGERKERGHYKDIKKENEKYEHYYKEQKCFDISQFEEFLNAMKQPLPAVFRITGYKRHAKQLLKNMKRNHFEDLTELKIGDDTVKPPVPLSWYPDDLAWQTDLNRGQIRKVPQLQNFHTFLIAESESGHITRQEAVSMIPPLLLDVHSHHKVLDMCAAPGSKTAQIVELLHRDENNSIPEGICVANDKDNKRCYMLVHQIGRLHSPSTLIVNHDASNFPEIFIKNDDGKDILLRYDRILCDVPCSGDGTMRKNTDVWVKWNQANAIYLHRTQYRILLRGLELLASGGQLVYSTCSLNPIEDEAVVAAAIHHCGGAVELVSVSLPGLKWSPGVSSWRVMDSDMNWYDTHDQVPEKKKNISYSMFPPGGQDVMEAMHLERCMRLLPHQQDTGGFFVAVLRKKKPLPWQKDELKCEAEVVEKSGSETTAQAPPRKKRKWEPGFKEDPFVFLTSEDEATSSQIVSFFGLKDFPVNQILSRTTNGKKKQLYFVSKLVKNIIENNINYVKVINTGVRVFSRSANTQNDLECEFRLVQDGSECIEPFMSARVIPIKICDVTKFLLEDQPKYDELSEELRDNLKNLAPGSMIYKYEPENENADVGCELLLCGWKGTFSSRLYMNNHERMHFLNMVGVPVPAHLLPNMNTRRARAGELEDKKKEGFLEEKENAQEEAKETDIEDKNGVEQDNNPLNQELKN